MARSSATMAFAMDNWVTYVIGSLTAANALFNGYALCVHPAFRKGGSLHGAADPFSGMSTAESEVAAYVRKNPDVAMKVGSTAAKAAASNPEFTKQAMAGATSTAASGSGGRPTADPFGSSSSSAGDSNPFA